MSFVAPSPLLSNKSLLLAKVESTYNVDAAPVVGSDAFLVGDPDYTVQPNILERNFSRPSLSPLPINVGRKLAQVTFKHELKGSGANQTVAKIGTLLRGCGFAQTQIANTASATNGAPTSGTGYAGPAVSWANTAASTVTGRYRIRVEKGGASATAKLRVEGTPGTVDDTIIDQGGSAGFSASAAAGATTTLTQGLTSANDYTSITYTVGGVYQVGDVITAVVGGQSFRYTVTTADTDVNGVATSLAALIDADARFVASASTGVITVTFASGAVVTAVTSGTTAITLGNSGAQITPTWTGSLVLGDYWDILLLQPGYHYTPVSGNFESLTIYMYRDGLLNKVTGCMGNVQLDGQAGNYGIATFTFTGQYVAAVDTPQPTSGIVYETTIPAQIELAMLALGGTDDFCIQEFQVDMQNTINPRDCVNASDGFNGVRISGRKPTGSVNPETTLEANHPFWANMAAATQLSFGVRVGKTAGNLVWIFGDYVQYGAIKYGNRNNILTYDVPLTFAAYSAAGNDEIRIVTA